MGLVAALAALATPARKRGLNSMGSSSLKGASRSQRCHMIITLLGTLQGTRACGSAKMRPPLDGRPVLPAWRHDGFDPDTIRRYSRRPVPCKPLDRYPMLGWRVCLASTLALLAVFPAQAQTAAGPEFWAVTGVESWDALNLRVAPNAD